MDITNVLLTSFEQLVLQFVGWFPNFLAALIVFVLGLSASSILARLVENLIDLLKVDAVIEKMGARPYFDRAGIRLDSGRFIGQLVFWFLALAFLLAASDILGLRGVTETIRNLLGYIPNVIVAALILLASVLLANFLYRVTRATASGAKLEAAPFVASVVKWAVLVFGILVAMDQLGIAENVVNTLLTGFVAMVAIAGGLAFGLGGKQIAEELLGKLRKEIEE
jgi:small-conductance mechanosensitive channel